MADESFYVTAKIGIADYSITVIPKWNYQEDDSYFTIRVISDLTEVLHTGVLHRTSNDRWEWVEGGFSQDEADDIGNKIDAHYD